MYSQIDHRVQALGYIMKVFAKVIVCSGYDQIIDNDTHTKF